MNNDDEIIINIDKKKPNKKIKKKKKKNTNKISNIKTVKKNQARKKRRKILLPILVVFIAIIILAMSGIFNVKEISVSGIDKLTENEVISLSGIQINENTFKLRLSKLEEKIKENPYVKTAKIKRKLPNKLQINIEERTIKYLIQIADSYLYIDSQGYILEISKEVKDVPILLGILTDLSNINPGDRLNKEDLIKINTLNKIIETAKNYEILDLIKRIDIADDTEYLLYLDDEGKTVYLGNENDLNTKIMWIKQISDNYKQSKGKIFVNMDLNEKKPYFREEK